MARNLRRVPRLRTLIPLLTGALPLLWLASCAGSPPMDEEYVAPPPPSPGSASETDAPPAADTLSEGGRGARSPTSTTPAGIEDHFKRADKYIGEENAAEAILELQETARRLDPNDPRMVRYHERVGGVYLIENNLAAAKEAYAKAIKLSKDIQLQGETVADVYAGMGLCLVKENNRAYAVKFFRKALSLEPSEGTRKAVEGELRKIEGSSRP
ncbi:MAG: hypothetical protein HY748_01755 [Elusimicrobia bacterium]|nr:hypothetical protein [Elusimicrobiota bacterium]